MKKISAIIVAIFLATFWAGAQNNPYAIDDECYSWFKEAEQTVDDLETDNFDKAQQKLLEAALRKKDTKAQTLYYVMQLKRTSRLAHHEWMAKQTNWNNIEWNARMEEDREILQRIAKATGYMQYYHYANELCQTYYFNTSQDLAATEMLVSQMQEAKETGDEYSMWKAQIYLGKLYQRISDILNTRKYLTEAVKVYERSEDPTIKRQGIASQLCDLADTYPVASDSARMFYHKAELEAKTVMDSVKVAYYNAQLAAWDDDIDTYRRNRDYCMNHPLFSSAVREGRTLFNCVDNMLEGKPLSAFKAKVDALYLSQQFSFVTAFAIKLQQWETASAILLRHVDRLYRNIYSLNGQRLDLITSQYELESLSADLDRMTRKVQRTRFLTPVLISIIVLETLALAVIFIRKRKKNLKKNSQ